jgi:hypothetical protein
MKKILILAFAIQIIACAKKKIQASSSVSFDVITESSALTSIQSGSGDQQFCNVQSGSGAYSGYKFWQFMIGRNGKELINLKLPTTAPDGTLPLNRDTTYEGSKM